jgi:hypothetical protein
MTDWQPIETAPKDGTFVMLFVPNGQLETGPVTIGGYWKAVERSPDGRFKNGEWTRFSGWLGSDADCHASWCDPTHWMPLPCPPVQER